MNIVFASHTEIGGTFVVGSHHLSREFARRGHRVLHMSAPVTPAHLLKLHHGGVRQRFGLWASGGRAEHEGVVNYVGFSALPWQLALRFASESHNLYARTLPSITGVLKARNMWPVDALIIDQPQLAGIENLLVPKMLVYRATDLYEEMTGSAAVGLAEKRLARKAALLVGTSEPVLSHLHQLSPATPTLLIENGVEFELFNTPAAPPPEYAHIPGPRAVYAGALDDRFDFEQMRALAQLPLQIVLIGPATPNASEVLGSLPNVHLLGPRPYRSLPGYLQHAQIGLLP
ncbi:MAG TPA: hypothetical protein VJM53_07695, partial [Burkholderiales bacterium]|nr:hypothetical protein [Burkholderiales bacterium]